MSQTLILWVNSSTDAASALSSSLSWASLSPPPFVAADFDVTRLTTS